MRRRAVKIREPDLTDVLLGSDFGKDVRLPCPKASTTRSTSPGSTLRLKTICEWPASPIPADISEVIGKINTITVRVSSASGIDKNIEMGSNEVTRLRGTGSILLKWLDDVTIGSFVHLVNMRRKSYMVDTQGAIREPHRPSGFQNIFERSRVLTHIFNTQFFTIWAREQNGRIPAFVSGSHWVLGIVDVDGKQFIYYDPYGSADTHNVIECAKQWIAGEAHSVKKSDVLYNVDISTWPVVSNPSKFPRQSDSQSCGVFVMYVAEHIERGVFPTFTQNDISVLRKRALWFLHEGIVHDNGDY